MFTPTIAVGELMLRSAIIYVFVFVLLRMLGKKHVGEIAPFDLVIFSSSVNSFRTPWWPMINRSPEA